MLLGADSFGAQPFASDVGPNFAVLSNYQIADADPMQQARYRVEAFPYDPDTAAVVPLFWAQIGADLKLVEGAYPMRVEEALHYSAVITQGEITARLGSAPNYGTMHVITAPNEGDSDDFERYYWDGRDVHVYRGFDELPAAEWKRVLSAAARGINVSLNGYTIELLDPSLPLQNPLQTATYAGTGGLEGGEDLADQRKPVCFGAANNITPRVIDRVYHIVQWHDRSSQAVRAMYDKGIELAFGGSVADLYAWTPVVGQYVTELANSRARVGGTPDGLLTMDVDGHNEGGSFASTHAEIAEAMLRDYAGLVDADLDLPSFAKLALQNQGKASYYQAGGDTSTLVAISAVLDDLLGFWTYNAVGQLEVGQLRDEPPTLTIAPEEIFQLGSQRSPTPIKARILEVERSWTVQDATALAGGVDAVHSAFVGQEYRTVRAEVSIPQRLSAIDSTIQTHFEAEVEDAAEIEAERQLTLFSGDRRPYTIRVRGHPGQLRMGRSVGIQFPRFRFGMGRSGIILGITERSSDESTQIVWWG
jgi:hypothetical protein